MYKAGYAVTVPEGANHFMYDPVIGRFLSPDSIVQTLDMSQALKLYQPIARSVSLTAESDGPRD